MNIKTERKQWLDSSLQRYLDDPSQRAVREDAVCMYRTDDGRECIVGQYIINYNPKIENRLVYRLGLYLPYGVLRLDMDFLAACQKLHDIHSNWDDSGLTIEGVNRYQQIVSTWCT